MQGAQPSYRGYPSNSSNLANLMHQESHWPTQGNPNTLPYSPNISHSQGWSNQMQQNPYPNTLQGMNTMNFPFIPQQVIHDALTLSTPVEAADEPVLVQAILTSRNKGETYKDALNSLHGKNGHSASLWKDYYLEHKDRLDNWIALCLQADAPKTTATAKKPVVAKPMLKREPSLSPTARSSPALSSKQKERIKKERQSATRSASIPPRVSGRTTQNSLSAPEPVFDCRLPAPNTEIRVPPPPLRSPSPPRHIVPGGRGHRYTEEDKEFFIKFIAWRLGSNPNLTRMDLCTLLAEKAPHHTAQSWASYWSNHHDLPDKILAAAQGEDSASGSEEEEDQTASSTNENPVYPPRRRPKYYESSLSSANEKASGAEDGDEDEEEEEDEDDDMPMGEYDENDMGSKGEPFTDADLYFTAKYVASFPNFDNVTHREKWEPYQQLYPQRAAKSWAEYYRRNDKPIRRLAAKIQRQQQSSRKAIDSQRARPSWAKRKHDNQDDEEDGGKRSRRD